MRIFPSILFFSLFLADAVAQKEEKQYYPDGSLKVEIEKKGDDWLIETRYPDQTLMGKASCVANNGYFTAGKKMETFYQNGKTHFYYRADKKELEEYDAEGNKMTFFKIVDGNSIEKTQYYTNGNKKYFSRTKCENAEKSLVFFPFDNSYKESRIYFYMTGSAQLEEEYRPDGTLYSKATMRMEKGNLQGIPEFIFYNESGKETKDKSKKFSTEYPTGYRYNGEFHKYHGNGTMSSIEIYKNNLKEGTWKQWYANGNPLSVINYSGDSQEGEQMMYHENGVCYSYEVNHRMFGNGPFISRHKNGKLSAMGNNKEAEFSFVCYYDSSGVHKAESVPFVAPEIKYYLEKPTEAGFTFEGKWKDNVRDGEWIGKFTGGNTYVIINYSQGVLHGPCKVYDNKGNLLLSCNYENGDLHGRCFKMFSTSPKDTAKCGMFTHRIKTGKWKSWFKPGKLEYEYEYSEDGRKYEIWEERENTGILRVKTIVTDTGKVMYSYLPNTGKLYNVNVFRDKNVNPDRYSYDENEKLKMVSQVIDDGLNKTFVRQYYPAGHLQVTRYCVNGIDDGLRTNYHPNGKIHSTINRSGGLDDGKAIFYDETGKKIRERKYVMGVEIVDKEELAESCQCTTKFEPLGQQSYFPSLERVVPLIEVNKPLMRFEIDSNYSGLFMRDYNKGNGSFNAQLICYSRPKIYVDGNDGIALHMNPCKNQSLHYEMEVSATHYGASDLGITVSDEFDNSVLDYLRMYFDYYELDELHRLKDCCNKLTGDEKSFTEFIEKKYGLAITAPDNEKQSEELWDKLHVYYEEKKMDDNYLIILEDLTMKLYDYYIIDQMKSGRDVREVFESFFSPAYSGYYTLTQLKSFFAGKNYLNIGKSMVGVNLPVHFFKPVEGISEFPLVVSCKNIDYTNEPHEKITIENDSTYNLCSPVFSMEKTGMEITVNSFALDLDASALATTGGKLTYSIEEMPFHYVERKSGKNKEYVQLLPDKYLSDFMGVVFAGDVLLKTENGNLKMKMEKCMVDGKEINGILSWESKSGKNEMKDITTLLKNKGVEIHEKSTEENGQVKVFFKVVK